MAYTHRELREAFHLRFLRRLLKLSDPRLYVLKAPHSRVRYLAFARHRLRLRPKATPTSHGTNTGGRYAPPGVFSM